ncbi:MAG: flagellum-specific ATP synthase FliI, partial [Deltaproteobacteria bacterium]|nr:flagellum-specific ATP synthase FliI [Deltaproteobacteria bacterium]
MSLDSSAFELPVYSNLETYISCIENLPVLRKEGRIMQVIGHMVEATNPGCSVGGMCKIFNPATNKSVTAEVVGFRKDRMLVMPLHNAHGIGPKCRVV